MKFSKIFEYAWGISNTEHEDFIKPAVTIILSQLKYWWSSKRVTQYSHLTLSTHAFYPHHATRAFEAVEWQDQKSDTAKS